MVSNLVSNAEHPPASAVPPPRDIVYVPDLRLGDSNSKPSNAVYSHLAAVDCFIHSGGRHRSVQSNAFKGFT